MIDTSVEYLKNDFCFYDETKCIFFNVFFWKKCNWKEHSRAETTKIEILDDSRVYIGEARESDTYHTKI